MERISNLNRKFILAPKCLYLVTAMQFYVIHQFRPQFSLEKFKIDRKTYGQGMGLLLAITFITNIFIATMNDKFDMPKFFMIGLLASSSFFFQTFFFESIQSISKLVFWLNMLLYLVFISAIPPLLDKFTLEYLSKIPNVGAKTYGTQRMFGTLGYLIGNFIVERLIRNDVGKGDYNFDNLRLYQLGITALAIVLCFFLISSYSRTGRHSSADIRNSWIELLKNFNYMFFIFIILLNGITRAGMTLYLSDYFKSVLRLKSYSLPKSWPGIIKTPIGILNDNVLSTTATFGVIFELICLFFSKNIIGMFGLYWPLLFAQIFQFLRFFGYYTLSYKGSNLFMAACFLEMLKGLNFGLTHASGVQIATILCPPYLKATSQMIYSGTFVSVSSIVAGFFYGRLFSSDSIKDKKLSVSAKADMFQKLFFDSMMISLLSIILFIGKYGFKDGLLSLSSMRRGDDGVDKKKEVVEDETQEY
ncbi:hypothetical protein DMUE_1250 [Dictyocoela muelleri]|nr:hypothetical protein DMUE_1250 [Dictyocoela muelleri]